MSSELLIQVQQKFDYQKSKSVSLICLQKSIDLLLQETDQLIG